MNVSNVATRIFLVFVILASFGIVVWAHLRTGYFVSPVKLALYVYGPALVGGVSLVLIFLSAEIRLLATICFATTLIALYTYEVYLQFSGQTHETVHRAMGHSEETDKGERFYPMICGQSVMRSAKDGSVVSAINLNGQMVQPLGGPANVLVRRPVNGADIDYTTQRSDSFGFNNPQNQWRSGEVEVVVLGDSFAYGADVSFGDGIADVIRERVEPTVNLGCGGNGPLLTLASLREYGASLTPKTLIWIYYEGNDLPKDIVRERRSKMLQNYLTNEFSQNLMARQRELDKAMVDFVNASIKNRSQQSSDKVTGEWFSLRNVIRLIGLRNAIGMRNEFSPGSLALFHRVISQAKDLVSTWQGRFIFVYLPAENRFTSAIARWDSDGYRNAVLDVVRSEEIEIVDVTPTLAEVENPRALYDGHLTKEGYRRVANRILQLLDDG